MKEKNIKQLKRAVIDVDGAHCASCAFTIEHLGRKVDGVKDIRVVTGNGEIHVSFEGNTGSLERIVQIVKHLGYEASIRWNSIT